MLSGPTVPVATIATSCSSDVMSVLAPDAAALRLERAAAAVVAPVPPLATATVPVTLDAVPVVLPLNVTPDPMVPPVMFTALAFCVAIDPDTAMLSTVQIVASAESVSTTLYDTPLVYQMSASPRAFRITGLVLATVPAPVVYVASGVVVPAA